MDFKFDIRKLFPNEVTCLKSDMPVFKNGRASSCYVEMCKVIDIMGESSAMAQHLPQVVTTFRRFRNSNQKLYVLSDFEENRVLGILKSGRKRLFIHDKEGTCVETVPLCVLDFYVHESRQRQGCGRRLFDEMLQEERTVPCAVAIDSPSPKMLQFLRKHYGLSNPIFASNNYVIYPGFFEEQRKPSEFISKYCDRSRSETRSMTVTNQLPIPSAFGDADERHLAPIDYIPLNSEQRRYHIPHTRVQAMPTKMTVIKPVETPETKRNNTVLAKLESPVISGDPENASFRNSERDTSSKRRSPNDNRRAQNDQAENRSTSEKKPHSDRKDSVTIANNKKFKYPVLSSVELNAIRSLSSCSNRKSAYTYVNAVRHHNRHTRLW